MKQILQSYRTGELWLADVPAPALAPGGAVVRTAASLVSAGTERMLMELAQKSLLGKARARPDLVRKVISKIRTEGVLQTLEKAFAKLDAPIAMGYSAAGVVVESSCLDFSPGDRVACAGAGFATHAEVNFVPRNLLARIPEGVSFDDACFTTVGAIAMQGVRQADVRLGERVVVIGLGLVGLLTVQLLRAAGCAVLGFDPDADRCALARQLGADDARDSDASAAGAFSHGHGVDAVIITAASDSNEPLELAAEVSRVKGRVVLVGVVGMNVPRDPFYRKELDLRLSMSYGPGRYDPAYEQGGRDYPIGYVRWTEQRNMAGFLDLLAAGRITPGKLVTHRFGIDDALSAYDLMQRREKHLGLLIEYPPAASDAPLSRSISLRSIQPSARIGVGFIGAGNFARSVLIPALRRLDRAELVAVCTATGMSAQQTASKQGFAIATTDENAVLGDSRVNTVFIATRHDSHARLACAALRAGKHVFVEKPLCLSEEELVEIEQAIESSPGRCLTVGYNRRFSSHTLAIRDAFAGRGGPMFVSYRVNAGTLPADSWLHDPQQGGRIVGEMCHFVDWCECVVGSVPVRVSAESVAGGDESLVANIRYADGSIATIQYITMGPPQLPKERVEVCAGGAAAVMTDFISTEFFGLKRPRLKGRQDKGFAAELSALLDAIRRGGEPPIAFSSLARTSRVTFAILSALSSGREVAFESATV